MGFGGLISPHWQVQSSCRGEQDEREGVALGWKWEAGRGHGACLFSVLDLGKWRKHRACGGLGESMLLAGSSVGCMVECVLLQQRDLAWAQRCGHVGISPFHTPHTL